jgi:hypothetical protein
MDTDNQVVKHMIKFRQYTGFKYGLDQMRPLINKIFLFEKRYSVIQLQLILSAQKYT